MKQKEDETKWIVRFGLQRGEREREIERTEGIEKKRKEKSSLKDLFSIFVFPGEFHSNHL